MITVHHRWKVLLGAAGLGIALIPWPVNAGSRHVPATEYPAHTRISQLSHVTNQQMDCAWGFVCQQNQAVTSAPVFHLRTQDDLHRLSGWAQFGDTPGGTARMLFAVFVSTYSPDSTEGMPWNVVAFSDFRGALLNQHYQDLAHSPRLLPTGAVGSSSAQIVRSTSSDVLAMTCWTGSIEVEGVVVYAHGSANQQRLALRDLTRQIRIAVNQ